MKYIKHDSFNWTIVRGLGELTILTRASFFMLVFVPILAGSWSFVRVYMNNHFKAINEATEILNNHQSAFDKIDDKNFNSNYENKKHSKINKFISEVDQFSKEYIPKTYESPNLPGIWAATFFASLFSIFGQLLYQLFAPSTIKKEGMRDYINQRKDEYIKYKTQYFKIKDINLFKVGRFKNFKHDMLIGDDIKKFSEIINEIKKVFDNRQNYDHKELKRKRLWLVKKLTSDEDPKSVYKFLKFAKYVSSSEHISGVNVTLNDSDFNTIYTYLSHVIDDDKFIEYEQQDMVTLIDLYGRDGYLIQANQNFIQFIFSFIFYTISILIIIGILFYQSMNVLNQTGLLT